MITQEKITDTASRLFVRHGVKTITTDRLAKELRTSKRTIYTHFEDKTALVRACLNIYHEKIRTENEEIIQTSKNAIEALGHLYDKIVKRSYEINPNFFSDIIHYHPGLLEESYRSTNNFAHQQIAIIAEWGIEDGIFPEDMDVEVVGKTLLTLLKLLKDNKQFPITKFSKERLTFGTVVPFLRGLCTPKGVKLLAKQEELFRITI